MCCMKVIFISFFLGRPTRWLDIICYICLCCFRSAFLSCLFVSDLCFLYSLRSVFQLVSCIVVLFGLVWSQFLIAVYRPWDAKCEDDTAAVHPPWDAEWEDVTAHAMGLGFLEGFFLWLGLGLRYFEKKFWFFFLSQFKFFWDWLVSCFVVCQGAHPCRLVLLRHYRIMLSMHANIFLVVWSLVMSLI